MSNLDHYQEIHLLVFYCKNTVNIYDILMVQTFFYNLLVQRFFFLFVANIYLNLKVAWIVQTVNFRKKKFELSLTCLRFILRENSNDLETCLREK